MADFEMQDSLGLNGAAPIMAGVPTPNVQMPTTVHPGQFAAMASAQASQQAQSVARTTMMFTPMSQVASVNSPALPAALAPGNPALASFSQQYGYNAQAIQSGYGPVYSPGIFGMGATPPLAGLPSPGMFTPPNFGVYRPRYPGVEDMPGMGLPRASVFNPLVFPQGTNMFSSPTQAASMNSVTGISQMTAGTLAGASVASNLALGLGASVIGGGAGAVLGGMIGGPMGAVAGMQIGRIAAPIGMQMSGLSGMITDPLVTRHVGDYLMNPLNAQQINRGQAVGPNLGTGGIGLDITSAAAIAPAYQRMAYQRTAGFNAEDIPRVATLASQAGMMNDVSGIQEGAQRLRQITGALRELMRVTNDPDITSAMRELSAMRTMGADLPQSMANFRSIRGFARMAGTDFRGIQDMANAGGLAFQGMGLAGATGLVFGAGGAGMARQAVGTQTFTPLQLALLGGEGGLAQRSTESSLAYLGTPTVAAFGANMLPGGGFFFDPRAGRALARGNVSLDDMVYGGVANLSAAMSRGGVEALGQFMGQQQELQSQFAAQMGPVGMDALKKMQALKIMEQLGVKGVGGFQIAAQAMTGDAQLARQMALEVTNPENIKAQLAAVGRERTTEAAENLMAARRQKAPGGFFRAITFGAAPLFGEELEEKMVSGSTAVAIGDFMGKYGRYKERGEAIKQGMDVFQTRAELLPSSPLAAMRMADDIGRPRTAAEQAIRDRYDQAVAGVNTGKLDPKLYEVLLKARGGTDALQAKLPGAGYAMNSNAAAQRRYRAELSEYETAGTIVGGGLGSTMEDVSKRQNQLASDLGISSQDLTDIVMATATNITSDVSGTRRALTPNALMQAASFTKVARSRLASNPRFRAMTAAQQEAVLKQIGMQAVPMANFGENPALQGQMQGLSSLVSGANAQQNRIAEQLATDIAGLAPGVEGNTVQRMGLTAVAGVGENDRERAMIMMLAAQQSPFARMGPEAADINQRIADLARQTGLSPTEVAKKYQAQIGNLQSSYGRQLLDISRAVPINRAEELFTTVTQAQQKSAEVGGYAQLLTPENFKPGAGVTAQELAEVRDLVLSGDPTKVAQGKQRIKDLQGKIQEGSPLRRVAEAVRTGKSDQQIQRILADVPRGTSVTQADTGLAMGGAAAGGAAGLVSLQDAISKEFPSAVQTFQGGAGQFASAVSALVARSGSLLPALSGTGF